MIVTQKNKIPNPFSWKTLNAQTIAITCHKLCKIAFTCSSVKRREPLKVSSCHINKDSVATHF